MHANVKAACRSRDTETPVLHWSCRQKHKTPLFGLASVMQTRAYDIRMFSFDEHVRTMCSSPTVSVSHKAMITQTLKPKDPERSASIGRQLRTKETL